MPTVFQNRRSWASAPGHSEKQTGSNFVRDNSVTDMELTSSRVRVIRALFSNIGCDKRRCDGRGGSEARD